MRLINRWMRTARFAVADEVPAVAQYDNALSGSECYHGQTGPDDERGAARHLHDIPDCSRRT